MFSGRQAIEVAQRAKSFGVILGTLGRQGNPHILEHVTSSLRKKGKQYFVLLLSEIFPAKVCPLREKIEKVMGYATDLMPALTFVSVMDNFIFLFSFLNDIRAIVR